MPNDPSPPAPQPGPHRRHVLLTGATGTIGQAVLETLVSDGHSVICYGRSAGPAHDQVSWIQGHFTDPGTIQNTLASNSPIDAVISCMASRTGAPADARTVDHHANSALLGAAEAAGIPRFILLSAICIQKPKLAFQRAKLAFESELQASGLDWTIIRPAAFFKSLSGQVARVQAGKPYLVFGDGTLTACKPISDRDLARYIVDSLDAPERTGRILPIGGPGPALTPRDMGTYLFDSLGKPPRFASMPPIALQAIATGLGALGLVIPPLKAKAELARIGHYYGTESMLVWNEAEQRYDADTTPEFGSDTLFDYFDQLLAGEADAERGDHAVF